MLVSIVITYYKYPQYIEECVESCVSQAHNPEVIIVNDGSNDTALDKIKKKYPQVITISHSKNMGYAAAKNTGILASSGSYIRMLDADDKLTTNAIARAIDVFDQYDNIDLVHGICLRWYGGKDTRGYNKKTYVHAQGRMWHRSVYEKFGLYYEPLRSMADKEFVYRLGVHPNSPLPKLVNDIRIKFPVALYRKHEGQMHRIRKTVKPSTNKNVQRIFKRRINQLRREGITRKNTRFM